VTAAGGQSCFVPTLSTLQSRRANKTKILWMERWLTYPCFLGLDGYVRIWSTEAICGTDAAAASKPKQLASMSNHSGTIHTVRFSPNGKYLASGADDKIVCIYTLDANPPSHATSFGRSLDFGIHGGRDGLLTRTCRIERSTAGRKLAHNSETDRA
jgi:WD40 repeat protein